MNLLEINLFKNCEEGKSGMVFISTNNNQACRILIVNGAIVAANMGIFKGLDALKELEKTGIKNVSYKDRMELPYKDEEKIESSDSALQFLGYPGSSAESPAEVDELTLNDEVYEPTPSDVVETVENDNESPKKKVRVYRGQIIED